MKINGTGTINIFSDNFFKVNNQCEIYINDEHKTEAKNKYYFTQQNDKLNIVNIAWNKKLDFVSTMFDGCDKIVEIDLSKFETSNIKMMNAMFQNCKSLTSLSLPNIDTSNVTNMGGIFNGCNSLISLDLSEFNTSKITTFDAVFASCINLEFVNFKLLKLNNPTTNYVFASANYKLVLCSKNEDSKMKSLLSQKKQVHCNNFNSNDVSVCYSQDSTINNKYICDICGKNYVMKNKPSSNDYINCYGETEGYYLDENSWEYKQCYISCKTCKKSGDDLYHYCLECKEEYSNEIKISDSDYKNCYEPYNEDTHFIFDESGVLIIYENEQFQNQSCAVLKAIDILIDDNNIVDINNGKDKKVIYKSKQVILTSTSNQKNNEEVNNITMNLGQCESIIKYNYNISKDNSLYILQIISNEIGMKIPKIEYEIYYPLNNDNELIKLNLTSCQGSKIDISISVKINDNLDKYNSSSDYYNDICSKTTSDSGTDISLNDRRNEFVNNNISLCEENCELIEYDYSKEKAKCSCDVKTSISSYDDIKFNKNDFFKSFIDIKNIFNINILKCYKAVFKIIELKKNYGFFIVSFVLLFYFASLIIFLFISYANYKKEIKNIIWALKFNEIPINNNQNIKKPMIINKNMNFRKKKKINLNQSNKSKIKNHSKIILLNFEANSIKNIDKIKIEKADKKNLSAKKILKKKDFEINSLNYKEALKLDHRNYCQYYCYLLKYNHPISFSFAPYNDYNIKIIKKFLFFFSFCSDFTINALFFTDETIHKIYQDKGKFNFLYQIPQTLYSTLIAKFIDTLIKNLALSQDIIINLKQEKKSFEKKHKKLLRSLNIKFILFFILAFVILIFFWYYITCFCGIYINSQIHLIKDSVISLITSLIIPFGLNIIPGMFRILSMKVKKPHRECLYKFSVFLENFLC